MELLEQTVRTIPALDQAVMERTRRRLDSLTKPPGSLGMLEDWAVQLAGITGRPFPRIHDKWVVVMAGDHGVVEEGVSAYPAEVTPQMVLNFLAGGAGVNVLARMAQARVRVVDMGVNGELALPGLWSRKVRDGTANLARGPAMSREEAVAALEAGIEVAQDLAGRGADLLATGDMGIGNTTPSSAILAALTGCPAEEVVGRGTGIDDERLAAKVAAVRRGLEVNRPDPQDALDVLHKVGGLEIAGLAGVILGAAARRVPVVVDGFISGAAALVATRLAPASREYLMASHLSEEPGHRIMLAELGLTAPLRLRMRLGEGTGAVLAFSLVEAACRILSQMATFAEAAVSDK
ncbi:MAG: nicotinate-nucleotide--dimethylbenzimidazole phosphoribosyltransferase [Thermaerobacter sp.]|nr:nicotinate-nucleotide--dimethylbenzimidazole phosphoribosyltransferase [Thermaerobacter sp.]